VGFVDGFAAVVGGASFFVVDVTFGTRGGDAILGHDVEMNTDPFELLGERVQIFFGEDGTFLGLLGLLLGDLVLGMLRGTVHVLDMLNGREVGLEEGITSIGIMKSQLNVGRLALVLRVRFVIARSGRVQARVLVG
jgi:hypothetical protein